MSTQMDEFAKKLKIQQKETRKINDDLYTHQLRLETNAERIAKLQKQSDRSDELIEECLKDIAALKEDKCELTQFTVHV